MIDLLDQQMEKSQPANLAATWMTVRTILYRYMLVFKRRWWVAFLTMSIGLAVAGWYAGQMPPSYRSDARMMVSGKITLQEGATYSEELGNFFGTQMELMQSGEVRTRALARVQALRPDLEPVKVKLSVGQQPKTSIFLLTAVAPDPVFAREYLNACMDEYIAAKREMRSEKSDSTLTALTSELASVEKDLRQAREELLNFQAQNNLGYLKEEGNSAGLYLANLNRQYAELKTEYQLLEALSLDQALDRQPVVSADGRQVGTIQDKILSGFGPMGDYLRARQQLQLLQAEREQLSVYMRPKHPDIIRLDEEITRTEKLIETFRKQSVEQLQSRREAIGLQMENLERAIKEWETKAVDLSRKLAEHDRIKANVDRLQAIGDRLSNNLRNVDMTKAVEQDMISILEKASEAISIRPGLIKVMLIGFGAGLAAGLAILFLMERLDDRIASMLDVQNHFNEKILGQVVHQDPVGGTLQLLQPEDERHSFAESFRSIRSSLLYIPKNRPKSILVTSAIPGEGKSTVSSNLAVAFALAGAKTLLVDADLRRGGVHKTFGLSNEAGLAEVLRDMVPWEEVVRPTNFPTLSVITRGGNLPHPSEHLLAPITDRFLKEVYQQYDYIIVDSAPVMVAEDTPSLAPKLDTVAVVMRFSVSSSRLTRRTIDRLKERQAHVLGLVLNEISVSMPEYGYHYYGSYYHDEAKA